MSLNLKYFVLKPKSKYPDDPYAHASRCALLTFAIHIDKTNPDMARELRIWVEEESRLENALVGEQNKDDDDDSPMDKLYVLVTGEDGSLHFIPKSKRPGFTTVSAANRLRSMPFKSTRGDIKGKILVYDDVSEEE
jgi:hypothetical protein